MVGSPICSCQKQVPISSFLFPRQLLLSGRYTQNPYSGHFECYGDITTVETNAGGLDYFQLADEPRTGLRLLRWNGATQPDYENRRLRIRHRSSRITS
jgi:hypothetical protein